MKDGRDENRARGRTALLDFAVNIFEPQFASDALKPDCFAGLMRFGIDPISIVLSDKLLDPPRILGNQ
jgi:hypothetical protein